jgi:hypothetical protein
MALRHLDFPSGQVGLYGVNKALLLNGMYAQVSFQVDIVDDPDPNITGNVIQIYTGSPPATLRKVLPSSQSRVGIGRRVWLPALPLVAGKFICLMDWRDGANSVLGGVYVDTTGRIVIDGGGGADVVSAAPALVANAWQHVEAVMDTATGSLEVRVEGYAVVSYTGRTIAGPIAQVAARTLFVIGDGGLQYLKDFAIWDGSGSYNNDWMGSIQVRELIPNADNSFNWLASTGTTGFDLIDDAPPNDDVDYISAINPPPAASSFDLSNLPVDVTSVRGLYAVVRSRKTDGGDGNLQVSMISGASTALGIDRPVTTSYTYWTDVFEVDPATAAPWSPSATNAVKLQVNRTL